MLFRSHSGGEVIDGENCAAVGVETKDVGQVGDPDCPDVQTAKSGCRIGLKNENRRIAAESKRSAKCGCCVDYNRPFVFLVDKILKLNKIIGYTFSN